MSKFLRSQLWLVMLAVCLLGQAFAQGGATGAMTGTIQDATGAVGGSFHKANCKA